jgi:hypothetical protein
MIRKLLKLDEPRLLFQHGQAMEDPRDGLTLFGPLDEGKPHGIRAGVIGTASGIAKFKTWVDWLQCPVRLQNPVLARPFFPGFKAAFRVPWNAAPVLSIEIDEKELKAKCGLDDRHQRVFQTVDLFSKAIVDARRDEESKPDVWFVVIPDYVRRYCRPEGIVAPADRHEWQRFFASARQAKELYQAPSLFADANVAAEPYFFKEHFRNQLKARLLEHRVATQILREGTLENIASTPQNAREAGLIKMQSQIAWNIATTAFYKSGGRPWKVDGIRKGVCYIGLVYKKDQRSVDNRMACCGAQMFLDSGDGVVFKGAVGPWHNTETGDFHLSAKAAHDLIEMAVKSYKERRPDRKPPDELFIHGKTTFNDQEWGGFEQAAPSQTNIVGVKIRDDSSMKLFRIGDTPVLRGTALVRNPRNAALWTRGWTPRLGTYPGLEVPNPLSIEICRGNASIETVLNDIMALTKLNYNACLFADGSPITLKFANAVGEVLTAGPLPSGGAPLPFMYYI